MAELTKELQAFQQRQNSDKVNAMMVGEAAATNGKKKKEAAALKEKEKAEALAKKAKDKEDTAAKKARDKEEAAARKARSKEAAVKKKMTTVLKKKGKEATSDIARSNLPQTVNNVVVAAEATLEVVGRVNESFGSNTTETEDEGSVLEVRACASNEGEDEELLEEEVPVVRKVHSGRVHNIGGVPRCMVRLSYEGKDKEIRLEAADGVVLDDPEYKVLLWIIKNKKEEPIWREQLTKAIVGSKKDKVTFFRDWEDWDTFVRKWDAELEQMEEDGGGGKGARKPGCTLELGSPLRKKLAPCKIHDFVPEANKKYARKQTGWCLDDIVCDGYKRKCGKEFVEHLHEAKVPGNGLVVSVKMPAYWCKVCHLVYCHKCYAIMSVDDEEEGGGRSVRRRLV